MDAPEPTIHLDQFLKAHGLVGTGGQAKVVIQGGEVLHEINGTDENDWFGTTVSGLGDADGDGRSDFVIGLDVTTEKRGREVHTGEARVHAGKDAEELHALRDGKKLKR